jgi:hypothetical protein
VTMSCVVTVSSMVMMTTEVSAAVHGVRELVEKGVVVVARGVSLTLPLLSYECCTPCCHSSNTQRPGTGHRRGAKFQSDHAYDEENAAGDPQPSHMVP